MQPTEAGQLFSSGLKFLSQGDTLAALPLFEKAVQMDDLPLYSSHLAYCIAKERGQFQLAVTLCEKAIARESHNSVHYLNLGKVFMLAGKKTDALAIFRRGLSHEMNEQIIAELNSLGERKPPIFPFLKRSNPLNKYLGLMLKRLGLR